jgi:ubiquinone/menaquinone biosynthesis C-methylase UbiE
MELRLMKKQFRSDDPERQAWQDPGKILTTIGLKPGMVFVDMGCGDGYFTFPAARLVGPKGTVHAVDIDADAIGRLRERASREGIPNIVAEAQAAEKSVVCRGCADIVFFGIDLHDFDDAAQVIRNAKVMLKPSGRLADLDWKDQPMDFGPPLAKRFSIAKARDLIEAGGFRVLSVADSGTYHYLIIAAP